MKKSLTLILLLALCALAHAQVSFMFDPNSIDNTPLKGKMERSISNLLTEIDRAGKSGANLNLGSINMEEYAKQRLNDLWRDLPFVMDDDLPVAQCLNDIQGYQVRGIKITLKPNVDNYDGKISRELTISLNRTGVITGVRLSMEIAENVTSFVKNGSAVIDLETLREIQKWLEDFRNYYNERNIDPLRQIYSDYALIITGSVVKRRLDGDGPKWVQKVNYTVQSKEQYIEKLERIFKVNKYVDVQFDNISIMRHNAKSNVFGVTLQQTWKTSNYCDDGWLFLIWDFSNRDEPQIIVRTWQPDKIPDNEIFSLDDFWID